MKPMSLYNRDDKFELLDLVANFDFKSATSISFLLGTYSDFLKPDDGKKYPASVFNVVGSVDIHHPCDGHIKAIFRFLLPERYHEYKAMKELVRLLLAKLQIPADETFEAYFSSPQHQASIENCVDRDGMTDRMYSKNDF